MTDSQLPWQLRAHANTLRDVADALYIRAAKIEREDQTPALVSVKMVTREGGLSNKEYTYRHDTALERGVLVVVPTTQRWQPVPGYAIVQGPGQADNDRSWYDAIEQVIA